MGFDIERLKQLAEQPQTDISSSADPIAAVTPQAPVPIQLDINVHQEPQQSQPAPPPPAADTTRGASSSSQIEQRVNDVLTRIEVTAAERLARMEERTAVHQTQQPGRMWSLPYFGSHPSQRKGAPWGWIALVGGLAGITALVMTDRGQDLLRDSRDTLCETNDSGCDEQENTGQSRSLPNIPADASPTDITAPPVNRQSQTTLPPYVYIPSPDGGYDGESAPGLPADRSDDVFYLQNQGQTAVSTECNVADGERLHDQGFAPMLREVEPGSGIFIPLDETNNEEPPVIFEWSIVNQAPDGQTYQISMQRLIGEVSVSDQTTGDLLASGVFSDAELLQFMWQNKILPDCVDRLRVEIVGSQNNIFRVVDITRGANDG